jgi:hypothetical protein
MRRTVEVEPVPNQARVVVRNRSGWEAVEGIHSRIVSVTRSGTLAEPYRCSKEGSGGAADSSGGRGVSEARIRS